MMLPAINLQPPPLDLAGWPARFMNPGELAHLVALARTVPLAESMVEFGCHEGRTAAIILRELPWLSWYVGIDVYPGYEPSLPIQRGEISLQPGYLAAHDQRFELKLRARGSLDLEPYDIGPMDIAFIDGDHSEQVVRHDTKLARSVVRSGGLIIWHDYHDGPVDVPKVLDEMHANGADIKHIAGTWLAFERR